MAALLAEFNAYLAREHADPTADSVSYRQFTLWLNQEELAELIREVRSAIVSKMDNEPAPHRRPYLASTILLPLQELRSTGPTAGRPPPVGAADDAQVRKPLADAD